MFKRPPQFVAVVDSEPIHRLTHECPIRADSSHSGPTRLIGNPRVVSTDLVKKKAEVGTCTIAAAAPMHGLVSSVDTFEVEQ